MFAKQNTLQHPFELRRLPFIGLGLFSKKRQAELLFVPETFQYDRISPVND